jgi:alpha-1,6-mannosyltransferase
VLPDGSGPARYAKFPGAPLMTVLIIVRVVRHVRRTRRGAVHRVTPRPVDRSRPDRARDVAG